MKAGLGRILAMFAAGTASRRVCVEEPSPLRDTPKGGKGQLRAARPAASGAAALKRAAQKRRNIRKKGKK